MTNRTNRTNAPGLRPVLLAWLTINPISAGCDAPESAEERSDEALPPEEDGFVNPLNPVSGVTERFDGDGYYSALDWTKSNPGVGANHCGEDWNYEGGGDLGKPVYATANGLVVSADHEGSGWGNIVMIKHYIPRAGDEGYLFITSMYAHLDTYSVSVGDVVVRGQQIGTVGDADGKYAPHLHFEMRWNENLVPTANHGYSCPDEASGTFDPTNFINKHPPGW